MWHTLLFGATAALFLAMTFAALFHLRWAQRLPSVNQITDGEQSPPASGASTIRCSVVVAARDEEAPSLIEWQMIVGRKLQKIGCRVHTRFFKSHKIGAFHDGTVRANWLEMRLSENLETPTYGW